MNTALFYDSETTGLPAFGDPSEAPHQPHIVQLAARLVDMDTRKSIASMDVIVRPDGWVIPAEVSAIHGITTEHALQVGIPEKVALQMFMAMWDGRHLVGHNESFDRRIVRIAQHRYPDITPEPMQILWKEAKSECTLILATPLCKIPPTEKMKRAGFNKFKSANLGEAHLHFTGRPLEDAHSALADVDGCITVYWAIKDQLANPAAAPATAMAA